MSRQIVRSIMLAALAAGAAWGQGLTFTCTPATLPSVVGEVVSVTCSVPTGGIPPYTWSISAGALPPNLSQDPSTGSITGTLVDPAGSYSFTVLATDSTPVTPLTGTQLYSGTTTDFTVTCTNLTTGPVEVGVPYSNTCTAAGGTSPYNWKIVGVSVPPLMAGSITPTGNPATIAYTPASSVASYQYHVAATDSSTPPLTAGTAPFTGAIAPAPLITTTSPLPAATVGVNYSETLTATGGIGTYTWAVSAGSSLPGGLSLNSATGVISGPPATAGPASFTIQVTDSNQVTATQLFALTINPALAITTTSPLPVGTVGVNYSQTLAATGGSGTYTWAVTVGSLPSPLLLNAATGAITGQPAAAGTSNFTIQVTDSNQVTATKAFVLTVNPALLISTTSPLPAATPAVAYSQTFSASGGAGGYTWAATGLPAWLGMSAAGALTGTPPVTAVDSTFTVTVTDSLNNTKSGSFTVPVTLAITTSSPLPVGAVGANYSQTLAATGGTGTYTWAVTVGSLPSPLLLNSTTGVISGQPAAAATSNFTIQVTDGKQVTAAKAFTLTIISSLAIATTSPLPAGTVGVNYSQTLAATGGSGTYTWAVTVGSLPSPLLLNSTTGAITGQPTTAATSNFTIQVTDSNQVTASMPFALTIDPALTITTSSPLANGTVNGLYNQSLAGSGGLPPYTWSLASGSLPNGLTLTSSPATGTISGTATAAGTFQFTIQLTDSTKPTNTVSKLFSITIAPFTITTPPTLPNATVGVLYSQTLAAAGGAPPYTWSITSGSLPAPLSLNSTAGAITGTPNAAASGVTFTVTVTDSASNTASQKFTLTIVTPPVITTTSPLPPGAVGVAYSQNMAASGGTPPYTWAITSGSLPLGLSLSTAGAISGKPTGAGTSSFTVQLTDATGVTASQKLTLAIGAPLTISTTSPLPEGELTIGYSQNLAATGGTPPYTWSLTGSGALPSGMKLSANGSLTGTPSTPGTFLFTVQATDSNSVTASAPLALTIAGVLTVSTPSALSGGALNASYSQALAPGGGVGPYTWTLASGTLPPGLNLSPAGVISGVPTTPGTFTFTALVTDALAATASRQFTIVIAKGLTINTPPTLPGATVGVSYSDVLQAAGGVAPYTWTNTSGSLPAGLSIGGNGNLAGVPTAAGTFSFTVQVTDSLGVDASLQLSITVAPALSITTSALPAGTTGAAYSQSLAATGGTPPYTWALVSGALPGGLTLSAGGTIAGTTSAAGTFSFTVQVTDSLAATATKKLGITVAAGLSITTAAALPTAFIKVSYSQTLAAAGGAPPYTWALTTGALPAGLTLNAAGAITGTPTAAGTFPFTATVTDSASATASQQFTLIVGGGLAITTTSLPGGKLGASYSQTLAATGGVPPYTFTTSASSLPPGITLSGAILSGTPTKTGSFPFTIQVTDSVSATATQQFTIAIGGVAIITSALPSAAVGTPYSQQLSASGTAPYTWAVAQGVLPGGLSLDASSGTIGGTPTTAGTSSVTIQVTDSTSATASAAFTLTVIGASFGGLSSTATSAQQPSFTLALGAAYAQKITGQLTLTFQPDTSLPSPAAPADDPSIQFSTGGRTASFTIPANSTTPLSFALQTGTVAGTITLTVTWSEAGGASLPSPAALTQTIQIAPAVPVITAVTASTTSSGFQVVITGYSNTREASQALLQFTPAAGQTLQTTSLPVSLGSAATTWFQSSTSDQYGGQFILTLPFNVTSGSASAIGSISVQLVNSQGDSTSASATL